MTSKNVTTGDSNISVEDLINLTYYCIKAFTKIAPRG